MKDSKYYKKMCLKNKTNKSMNSIWMSKLLISIIIVLVSLIVTNFSSDIKNKFISTVLESNISFNGINNFYHKYVGNLFKDESEKDDNILVSNIDSNVNNLEMEEVNGSYEFNVGQDYPLTFLESGIIVFVGEKDELGNTVIVQGNNGVDLWYSHVLLNDYSLYDYVKKGDNIGTLVDDTLVVTIMKDGNKLKYDEYFK